MTSPGNPPRIAFQGERGAFSEEAVIKLLGEDFRLVPRPTFEALFSAVPEGAADFALAPLENSLAGSVHQSYDLLLESPLHIISEVTIPIVHNLIGCPGAKLENIRVVQSHPVALAQCLGFFVQHPDTVSYTHLDVYKRQVFADRAGPVAVFAMTLTTA